MTTRQSHNVLLDLSGPWDYRLDPDDRGMPEIWSAQSFDAAPFELPGTTTTNHVGHRLEADTELNEDTTRCLRQRYDYLGALWVQRRIVMPPAEALADGVELYLERVIFESAVWIDGHYVGRRDSLSAAHVYDLTPFVEPGREQTLTIRIDNRDVEHIYDKASAYTDETQTLWNGIVGAIELRAGAGPVRDVQVFPRPSDGSVHVLLRGVAQSATTADVLVRDAAGETVAESHGVAVHAGDNGIDVVLPHFETWDEFHPTLYTLSVIVDGRETDVTFGMRELSVDGRTLRINGNGMFLRGTLDCCVFPKTGFPPCDVASYEHIYRRVKEAGLNHVRYHSWCPPEAAFEAADRLGVYLSVEGPFWMDDWFKGDVGSHIDHYDYIEAELNRIVDAYGNHPSLCMLVAGNELSGDYTYLEDVLTRIRKRDPRFLTTLTSNSGCIVTRRQPTAADDYFVDVQYDETGIRGQAFLDEMVEQTTLTYDEAVGKASLPLVAHELGQYAVFPDVSEIPEYDGALAPVNLEVIKNDLERKGLIGYAKDYVLASGHLAAVLYRDDIESTMRTRGFGGFQMLDLHDFPGQSTATVGLLNAFWEPKGIDDIDLHCDAVKPLVILDKRQFVAGETLTATLKVFNYGADDIEAGRWTWSLDAVDARSDAGVGVPAVHLEGEVDAAAAPQGDLTEVGAFSVPLDCFTSNTKARLAVRHPGLGVENSWDIWVYAPEPARDFADDVTVSDRFDDRVRQTLERGGKAVILADPNKVAKARKGEFFPVFWSPVWFKSVDPCGMFCDERHPALRSFPASRYSELVWKDPIERSFSIVIDALGGAFKPITQIVPNFYTIEHATNLFECAVGDGRLLVCSVNLDATDSPSVLALRNSIVDYVNGDGFAPVQSVDASTLTALLNPPAGAVVPDHDAKPNLALRKSASTDGSKSKSRGPEHAVDGSPLTFWESINSLPGHWWRVDLRQEATVSRIEIDLQEPQDTELTIDGSVDGSSWTTLAQRREQAKNRVYDIEPQPLRYIRVTYVQPSTIGAGMTDFRVS